MDEILWYCQNTAIVPAVALTVLYAGYFLYLCRIAVVYERAYKARCGCAMCRGEA